MSWTPERVFIDPVLQDRSATRNALEQVLDRIPPDIPRQEGPPPRGNVIESKRFLFLTQHKGSFVKKCPGVHRTVSCNYYVISPVSNCTYNCSYCFLLTYIDHTPAFRVFLNTDDLFEELGQILQTPGFARIGTGELSDSLSLDPITHHSRLFVDYFEHHPQVTFELKTKSTETALLFTRPPSKNTVVAWSLSLPEIAESEEQWAPPVDARIQAAAEVADYGYPVGFHFDPIIAVDHWEDKYGQFIRHLFNCVDPDRVAWISLGTLRFLPELKRIAYEQFPKSRIFSSEFVRAPDGKMRYFFRMRERIYQTVHQFIQDMAPRVPLYFCMEDPEIWRRLSPRQSRIGCLDEQFRERMEWLNGPCRQAPSAGTGGDRLTS